MRVTMLVVTREGDERCKLRPPQRATAALVYLGEHTTLAKIANGFGISESTADAFTSPVIDLLADGAPGLLKVLRESEADFVLQDSAPPGATGSARDGRTIPASTADTA